MKITDYRIRFTQQEGKLKAVASVTFDDEIAVHGIKIITGESRMFVAMPAKKLKNGEYQDIVHPVSREAREVLESFLLGKYEAEIVNGQSVEKCPEETCQTEYNSIE